MSDDDIADPDRAAILARRRRFIALAISGMAAGGCKHGSPEPCLSVPPNAEGEGEPEGEAEPAEPGPFVEDPGTPVEGGEPGGEVGGESGETEPKPQPCLKVKPNPQPCLKVKPAPHPCLMISNNGET